jgi:hypothetical protein
MCVLSNESRYYNNGKVSWEDGDTRSPSEREDCDLIKKANTIPITQIFNQYNLLLDDNKKMICPFSYHKGGKERSASFYYYSNTNTFWCFGCNTGRYPCDFVAAIEGIPKIDAAKKILSSNMNSIQLEIEELSNNLDIMISFSNSVREFYQCYNDPQSINFIEKVCKAYDSLNLKYGLNDEALTSIIQQLEQSIEQYICRH